MNHLPTVFNNPYLLVVLGSLGGTLLAKFKGLHSSLLRKIKGKFIYSITIEQNTELYDIFDRWLYKHHQDAYKSVNAITKKMRNGKYIIVYKQAASIFTIRYKNKRILISQNEEKLDKISEGFGLKYTKFTLTGYKIKDVLSELLEESTEEYRNNKISGNVDIYGQMGYEGIYVLNEITPKKMDNLIYPSELKENLMGDINRFLKKEEWYKNVGISYKRAYCLYGPPGTGKTSLVLSIAAALEKDIYMLDLASMTSEESLIKYFANIPYGAVVLMEDIDRSLAKKDLKVSISSLLAVMDGVYSKQGVLIFMTTNHLENIDPAILRDGRIDQKIEVPYCTNREIEQYFSLFYTQNATFAPVNNVAMASIQEICIRNMNDPQQAKKEINSLSYINQGEDEHEFKT